MAERQFDDEARSGRLADRAPCRFSAQMRPPAPSTICRAIERPEPGILAEIGLARALGVEAVEDGFEIVRRDAGAFVLDRHAHGLSGALRVDT